APVVGQSADVGKHVDHAGRGEQHTRDDGVTVHEFDTEIVVPAAGHTLGAAREDLTAVAAYPLAFLGDELAGRGGVPDGSALRPRGGCVARFSRIDDDDRPALPAELDGGGE